MGRSGMIKGLEALVLGRSTTARQYGVEDPMRADAGFGPTTVAAVADKRGWVAAAPARGRRVQGDGTGRVLARPRRTG